MTFLVYNTKVLLPRLFLFEELCPNYSVITLLSYSIDDVLSIFNHISEEISYATEKEQTI